jgi:hypothetical protein
MRFERAVNRGMNFGAMLGVALALTGIAMGAPLIGTGFSGLLFGGPMLGMVGEAFAGIVVGAAAGAAASVTGYTVMKCVPGASYVLGAAPPRHEEREIGKRPAAARGRGRGIVYQQEESDDRNTGFVRQLEEQRISQELMQGNELG